MSGDSFRAIAALLSRWRSAALNWHFETIPHRGGIAARDLAIIAPHPDDETFACGGLIARKMREAARVDVIFMTRGEASHDGCCALPRQAVGSSRQAAASKAMQALGVAQENLHWLGLPDSAIPDANSPAFASAAIELERLLRAIGPQAIVYPHRLDLLHDHVNTRAIAVDAARRLDIRQRYSYPTWMRLRLQARHLVRRISEPLIKLDIRAELPQKEEAIRIYLDDIPRQCANSTSSAGRLEEQFINLFRSDYEIFFDESPRSGRDHQHATTGSPP